MLNLARHEAGHAVAAIAETPTTPLKVIAVSFADDGESAVTDIIARDGQQVATAFVHMAGAVFSFMLDDRFAKFPVEKRLAAVPIALPVCATMGIAAVDAEAYAAAPLTPRGQIIAARTLALLALWCGEPIAAGIHANEQAGVVASVLNPLAVLPPLSQQAKQFETMAATDDLWSNAGLRTGLVEYVAGLPPLDISELFMRDITRVAS